MSSNAKHGVSGLSRSHSTHTVDHSSTEPRVGSSNLSGRARQSGNTNSTRNFLAACITAGLSERDARRLLASMRMNARRAAVGLITPAAAVSANRALTARVLQGRPSFAARAVAA